MSGFWQTARDFFTGRAAEATTPALTPEGAALGFEWEGLKTGKGVEQQESALLWPEASEALEIGPLAGVDRSHPATEWTINGEIEEGFETRNDAMYIAEENAAAYFIEPLAEASESYHAKLAALAESRGADVGQDTGRDVGLDR